MKSCLSHTVGERDIALVQLNVSLAVETAATQTKPASAGFKNIDFSLVRAGGLRLCSREFIRQG